MYAEPTFPFEWIRTKEELENAAGTLAGEELLSVDTETSGWQTGNEQLCLIQIGVPSTKKVLLVDVLSSGEPRALGDLLAAPTPLIVAHNASFEERQFARYGMKVKGVRDTLAMARELRPDLPNHTLRTCCKLLLGVELRKDQQVSDWSIRPLSDDQVKYACLDAEVALSLYNYLNTLERRVETEIELGVPDLMRELSALTRARYDLTAAISHEMAFLEARARKVRDVLRQKLIDGAEPYDGELGRCSITKVKRTDVNTARVRELYPEFASEVIREYVDRKVFESVSRERGLPKNAIESVLDVIGYNDRLNLVLKDDAGEVE